MTKTGSARRALAAQNKVATGASAPTQPRPRDSAGRDLDEYGLPLPGPARAKALAALGKPDPHIEPDAWRTPANATATLPDQGNAETVAEPGAPGNSDAVAELSNG